MGKGKKWTDAEKHRLRVLMAQGHTQEDYLQTMFPDRPIKGITKMIWVLSTEDKMEGVELLVREAMKSDHVDVGSEIENKMAMMVGLKKSMLPMHTRKHIAGLVMQTEKWLTNLPRVVHESTGKGKEAAVLMISDLHSGKKVFDDYGNPTYDKDILALRLATLKARLIHLLTNNLRPEKMDELHILLLGDIVDGSGIYPNQELNQDMQAVQPQVALATAGIWDVVRTVRAELNYNVYIHGIRGNHGRQAKYAPAENNFDFMVYQSLRMLAHYEDPEVGVNYSTTTDYLNVQIKGKRCHMRHIAPPQAETPAARARFGGWREKHKWDFMCYGHRHHPSNGTYMGFDTLMNGSFVGDDDLSEAMAVGSRPSQTLFGVDKDVGLSFRYNLYLDKLMGKELPHADDLLARYPSLA
jgi:hypothetical protein